MEHRRAKCRRWWQHSNKGPNAIWHMDSCDKLKPYGIEIYGCTDSSNYFTVWMEASTKNYDPKVVVAGRFFFFFFFWVNTPLYNFQRCENDACSYWSVLDVGPQADLVKKDLLLVISFMMIHTTESDITIFYLLQSCCIERLSSIHLNVHDTNCADYETDHRLYCRIHSYSYIS